MANLTHLQTLRVGFLGAPLHSIHGEQGSWARYLQRLVPVHPHLNRLDIVCARSWGDDWIDEVDEPTSFANFATLRHLELPSEVLDVSQQLPKILPPSLEYFVLYTVSDEVLVWLTELPRLSREFQALRRVTLDTRGWWNRYEDVNCIRCIAGACMRFVL